MRYIPALLLFSLRVIAATVEWSSANRLPEQVTPPWQLSRTGSARASLQGRTLVLETSASDLGPTLYYGHQGNDLSFAKPFSVAARVKIVPGNDCRADHAYAAIFFTVATNVGGVLFIGCDQIFVPKPPSPSSGTNPPGRNVFGVIRRPPPPKNAASVDTDGNFHDYRISVDPAARTFSVYYDEQRQPLDGTSLSNRWPSPGIGVGFGDPSGDVGGRSEWKLMQHTAHLPVADAGRDQIPVECAGPATTVITLDGRASQGTGLSYTWRLAQTVLGTEPRFDVALPTGTHAIDLEVRDPAGLVGRDNVVIDIVDNSAPRLRQPPDIAVSTATTCTVSLDPGMAAAEDLCGVPRVEWSRSDGAGSLTDPFPIGVTKITWTATDGRKTSRAVQSVTVAPEIRNVVLTPNRLLAPGGDVDVTVAYDVVQGCGVETSLELRGDTSSGSSVLDDHHVRLRAELLPEAPSYTIIIVATDRSGNATRKSVRIPVVDGSSRR